MIGRWDDDPSATLVAKIVPVPTKDERDAVLATLAVVVAAGTETSLEPATDPLRWMIAGRMEAQSRSPKNVWRSSDSDLFMD